MSTPMPGKPAATTVHIAIVGAGIGGLALAIGLLHQNVSFTLYESAAHYSAVGAGVGLGPTALRAMELIDKRFRQLYNQISSGNLTPDKEHIAMEVLYAEDGFGERRGWKPAPFGAECYTRTSAHRRDLLDVMTSLIPRERVRFNKRVLEVVEAGENDTVRITFDDGEVVEADAVIGCDGVKGPTRQAVLAGRYPDQVKAFYSGKEEMVADFADVVDRRLVRLLHWAKPVQWSLWHHPGTPTYYNGRICLLGDSAHATTPHQASGAGQCLEDALVLSSVLGLARDRAEITNAFKVYDDIRRPRAQAVVTSSQDAGQLYTFTHPHLGEDMDRIVDNLNQRFLWIWEHDLQADVELAHQQFMGLAQMSETTHGPLSL